MIFQQLMALSKLKPRKLINLVLSIAALIAAIVLWEPFFQETNLIMCYIAM